MKRAVRVLALIVGVALIAIPIVVYWQGVKFGLGVSEAPDQRYGWWSGSGSVIVPLFTQILGFGTLLWWHHTCHDNSCLRVGKYTLHDPETGAVIRTCKKHIGSTDTPHHDAARAT